MTVRMPPDVHALAERLKRDYERFSPAQQSLARYLADHLADVPLLSAHEVARASHCSPATVVRFAQALGYSGYPEMQRTVRRAQRPGLPPRPGDRQLGLPLSADGIESALAAERLAKSVAKRRRERVHVLLAATLAADALDALAADLRHTEAVSADQHRDRYDAHLDALALEADWADYCAERNRYH